MLDSSRSGHHLVLLLRGVRQPFADLLALDYTSTIANGTHACAVVALTPCRPMDGPRGDPFGLLPAARHDGCQHAAAHATDVATAECVWNPQQ